MLNDILQESEEKNETNILKEKNWGKISTLLPPNWLKWSIDTLFIYLLLLFSSSINWRLNFGFFSLWPTAMSNGAFLSLTMSFAVFIWYPQQHHLLSRVTNLSFASEVVLPFYEDEVYFHRDFMINLLQKVSTFYLCNCYI